MPLHSSNPAGKWARYSCHLKATHQWMIVCGGGNTLRNGRGALLISCLLRLSCAKLNWMCLGCKIQVLVRALVWVRGEGFKVQS